MEGTKNIVEAVAEAGVKRILYVSSIAALNYSTLPTKESYGHYFLLSKEIKLGSYWLFNYLPE